MFRFSLEFIDKTPYLVPFGQAVSCAARSIKLNPTGAVMWQKLCEAVSACGGEDKFISYYNSVNEELRKSSLSNLLTEDVCSTWVNSLCDEFEAYSDSDRKVIEDDALEFIAMLDSHHVFKAPQFNSTLNPDSITKHFNIAGLDMTYTGPSKMYPQDFEAFVKESGEKCANSGIYITTAGILTRSYKLGTQIIKTRDVSLFSADDGYFMTFDTFSVIKECEIHNDGRVSLFYHIPSVKESGKCINRILHGLDYERGRYEVFHAIRFAFLFFIRNRGVYALHSASFLYNDKIWLVSAPSGTGKSTHTAIWNKVYNTPLINGDLNCIDISGSSPVVRGTPWCGTSGIFDTNTYPLGGVILLSRGMENKASDTYEAGSAALAVANRLISPSWNEKMLHDNIAAAERICRDSLVFSLACDMSDDAARVCKDYIDNFTDKQGNADGYCKARS